MQLDKLTQNTAAELAQPIWDNIILASNERNYQAFSKDFSTEMLEHATPENILDQWDNLPILTSLNSEPEFMGFLKNRGGVRVLWKQKSSATNDELLGLLDLIIEGEQVKVNGAQIV